VSGVLKSSYDADLKRWGALLARLGAKSDADAVFWELLERYAEPQRAYHTFHHIQACLATFDEARDLAERPDEVEVALWLHDVVYDPHAGDNEEQSAQWAVRHLQRLGVPEPTVRLVCDLIRATRHDRVPCAIDAKLVMDIDLAILGRDGTVFDVYERQIGREYDWVPEAQFREGRTAVLRAFLERAYIYHTEFFRDRLEAQARTNLARSLEQLTGA